MNEWSRGRTQITGYRGAEPIVEETPVATESIACSFAASVLRDSMKIAWAAPPVLDKSRPKSKIVNAGLSMVKHKGE